MPELAPGREHGFGKQGAVTEDLRHRQARGAGGHLEVVQIHGHAVRLTQLNGSPYTLNRVHPITPASRPLLSTTMT